MIETKEKTVLNPTVGAVEGQSIPCTSLSIAESTQNFNDNFSDVRLTWNFDHADRELWKEPPDPLLAKLSELVSAEQPVWSGTATDLVDVLDGELTPIALAMRLNVRASKLMNEYGIRYENSRTHAGRTITLTLINQE